MAHGIPYYTFSQNLDAFFCKHVENKKIFKRHIVGRFIHAVCIKFLLYNDLNRLKHRKRFEIANLDFQDENAALHHFVDN